jgi:hypothetical protein
MSTTTKPLPYSEPLYYELLIWATRDVILCQGALTDARIVRDDLIVSLHDEGGVGCSEIGRLAELTPSAVRDILRRAHQ